MPLATVVVIPARAGSTRFPNKPLAQLGGRSVLQRVWQLAQAVPSVQRVVVASDDAAILAHVRGFGGEGIAVTAPCRNGSERVALALQQLKWTADVVVNLQGDAPLVPPWVVAATVAALQDDAAIQVATPAIPLVGAAYDRYVGQKRGGRSSGTTVTFDLKGRALYFSKAVIPNLRQRVPGAPEAWQHVGLYAFRPAALQAYAGLSPTPLEEQEQLEQLRWLEHGRPLHVVPADLQGRRLWSIDHPEDLAVAETILAAQGELGCDDKSPPAQSPQDTSA